MDSSSVVACREIFDENSQPSAEEISEYACQLGIDPESESHLLPLARDGLMQALPTPWKAFFDEKLQTHYYYNEETKNTQWEHPLDHVYKELVKKARDVSMLDDTCASVQELLTSEENTKHLERLETKVESDDDDLTTDSEQQPSDKKDPNKTSSVHKRPIGRPPLAPLSRLEKKLSDLRISPLRRSIDGSMSIKPNVIRNTLDQTRPLFERPKTLFKQQSEIIDLKMHVLTSPEEENFSPLLPSTKVDKGLPLNGKGNMFLRISRSNLPSPDTEKSSNLDSVTKSDPPKGILREKSSDYIQRKIENIISGKGKQSSSFDEDKKSVRITQHRRRQELFTLLPVRFHLENPPEATVSPGSNSSSELNDGQSSIISAAPHRPSNDSIPHAFKMNPLSPIPSALSISSKVPNVPLSSVVLSPLVSRPPIPPRIDSPRDKNASGSERDSFDSESRESRGASPRRRLVKPPPSEYIKPGLFQKNFQKISDLVRRTDIEHTQLSLEEPTSDKEARPRSPMIPLKSKISINLMESIESETSIDSPDREFANLDLNDLDDSHELNKDEIENKEDKQDTERSIKLDYESDKSHSKDTDERIQNIPIPQIRIPKLDLFKSSKFTHSDSEDSRRSNKDEPKSSVRSNSIDIPKEFKPPLKLSPTPSLGAERSPRLELNKPFSSPLSTFKPLNKASITPLKSDSACSLGKSLSPRLDGVMLSQGKSSSDNVVVVYQFETQDEVPKIKSPIPDMGVREMLERNKADERRRLELNLQKELEMIRVDFGARERRMKAELQTELRESEEKFLIDKKTRIMEQAGRQKQEMDEALSTSERNHQEILDNSLQKLSVKYKNDVETVQRQHEADLVRQREDCNRNLLRQKEQLEIENDRALSEVRDQLQMSLFKEKSNMMEENRGTIDKLREEHAVRVNDLTLDYRAEIDRLRSQHACHLEEVRVRLSGERAAAAKQDERVLNEKYKCLKEKYAKLKRDVQMSIERRNKRREMSMTTGSETEKSNSHKATQSLERCKEVNETSIRDTVEPAEMEPKARANNNQNVKCNDNETTYSESAHKSIDNNNDESKHERDSASTSLTSALKQSRNRRACVAFREPPRRGRERDRDIGATTDYQDSSDATTADERSKEAVNGNLQRRRFTRLKSASTSRLNYSPKRGDGWSSPLESLRQQLRKLDDLEDQFPDLAGQPPYSFRYPFTEIGSARTCRADSAELEFVRHRAAIEREGMRRARTALRRRATELHRTRVPTSPHRVATHSEEREATELEVALHRARALLGEKEIRLRYIERSLRRLAHPTLMQEATTSDASSGSGGDAIEGVECIEVEGLADCEGLELGLEDSLGLDEGNQGGAVLRSLRALHADVRDIWRALDARRPHTASPEISSCMPTTSHTRMTLSAPEPIVRDNSDSIIERARGLRAWLQTTP